MLRHPLLPDIHLKFSPQIFRQRNSRPIFRQYSPVFLQSTPNIPAILSSLPAIHAQYSGNPCLPSVKSTAARILSCTYRYTDPFLYRKIPENLYAQTLRDSFLRDKFFKHSFLFIFRILQQRFLLVLQRLREELRL